MIESAIETAWADVLADFKPDWLVKIRGDNLIAESRRKTAKYDTGTISEAACVCLRALTERLQPEIAVEIGTFIGTSAAAIMCRHLYTCDKSNDCVQSSKRITCHPYTGSTRMLGLLAARGVKAEFFFFDGRIKDPDVALILHLSTSNTVYAFDDYEGEEKGVINVGKLWASLTGYRLIEPASNVLNLPSRTTIALLVPQDFR